MRKKMPVMLITVVVTLFLFSATASAALSGGSTIGTAPTVTMGVTSISYGGTVTYFKFVAPQNYSYDIYSTDITGDSYGYLYDSAGSQLAYNDDGGDGLNFKIVYTLSGGVTYYIGVRNYGGSAANTCNLNIDYGNAPPVVTDGNISISGSSGIYKINDTVTATWNNTAAGDNNTDISSVYVNFSQFGGGASVAASNSSGTWTASYTLTSGNIDAANRNVSVTANDTGGLSTTAADTSNASVDNQLPVISDGYISINSGTGAGGTFISGDTVQASWDNTASGNNNADISSVTVNFSAFGGGAAVSATNNSGIWVASYTIGASHIDVDNVNISFTAIDDAGNSSTASDTSNVSVDNQVPVVTDGNIDLTGASGIGGSFIVGDTAAATWDNTSSGDNNSDIAGVTFDFSEFGGGSAVIASESSGIWTASYTIVEDSIEAANLNVSVTATDDSGQYATEEDSTDATVDSIFPTISLSCSDSDYVVKGGDIVVITATFSEPMAASPGITIDGADVDMEEMTVLGSGIIWTYEWDVPSIDTSVLVTISGSDASGNHYIFSDLVLIEIDSTNPEVTGVSDREVYIDNRTIFFNEGTAVLNNSTIGSGTSVKNPADYRLVVTDRAGNATTVEFSIALEKATALVGGYYYQLIDIEHETKNKDTKVMLNINSEVLADVMDSVHENKDINITLLENRSDKFTRKFSLGMTLADLQLIRSKGGLISLEVEIGAFELDPKVINIDRLLESFMGVASKDIWVELKITPAHYYRNYVIERVSENDGKTVISESVSFDLYCSHGVKTVTTVNLFGEMDIMIPVNEKDISEDLKAVRLMEDMTLETIDIEIVGRNGIYYAKFRSSTNGTFAIVSEK